MCDYPHVTLPADGPVRCPRCSAQMYAIVSEKYTVPAVTDDGAWFIYDTRKHLMDSSEVTGLECHECGTHVFTENIEETPSP